MLSKTVNARIMIPIVSPKHRDACASLVAGLNGIKKINSLMYFKIIKMY
ncbi:MAG: hypothetical protein PHV06_07275 [bacterium]|nr:hypothetical protein [bacterium]